MKLVNTTFFLWLNANSKTEQPFMDTAERVEAYLERVPPFSTIRHDVESSTLCSEDYLPIANANRSGRGVLLYCILDISEAIDLLSKGTEQEVLIDLRNHLEALYRSYFDEPVKHFEGILSGFSAYLNLKNTSYADAKKTRLLYHTFYLLVCSMNQEFANLPSWVGFLAKVNGFNLSQARNEILMLIKQLEDNIRMFPIETVPLVEAEDHELVLLTPDSDEEVTTQALVTDLVTVVAVGPFAETTLETTSIPPDERVHHDTLLISPPVTLSDTQRMLQDFFDARYLALFTKDGVPQERLNALVTLSQEIVKNLSNVCDVRIKEQEISAQKVKILELLNSVSRNDTLVLGRKYFVDLMNDHAELFGLLLTLSQFSSEKRALLASITAQTKPSTWTTSLYALSTVASPLIATSRAVLQKKTQDYLASWMPETLDAEAKRLTKVVAGQVLEKLQRELDAVAQQTCAYQDALVGDELPLRELIRVEPIDRLTQLALLNTVQQPIDALILQLISPEDQAPVVTTPIQDRVQQRYVHLIQAGGDEQAKVNGLIAEFRAVAKDLGCLLVLKTNKEDLETKLKPLEALTAVFQHQTTNQILGAVPNKLVLDLRAELLNLEGQFPAILMRLAAGDAPLQVALQRCSAEQVQELITTNTVTNSIEGLLLSLVTSHPVREECSTSEQTTAQAYFNQHYRAFIHPGVPDESQGLILLSEAIDRVSGGIPLLLSARAEYAAASLKAQQLKAILAALELHNTNALLINLIRARSRFLDNQAFIAKSAMNQAATTISFGNEALTDCLIKEKVESLQLLRVTNTAAKECLIEYTRLKEKLVLLQEMNKGCSDLDCYIVTNTTWWVKLTNFLARFCSLFKTTSGTMIDEATLLKNELAACRLTCEQEIKSHLVVMQKNNDLGHELLAALPGQQDVVFKEVGCPAESFDRNKTNNLLSKLSLFGLGKQDAAPNCSEEDDFLWFDEASGHPSSCGQ